MAGLYMDTSCPQSGRSTGYYMGGCQKPQDTGVLAPPVQERCHSRGPGGPAMRNLQRFARTLACGTCWPEAAKIIGGPMGLLLLDHWRSDATPGLQRALLLRCPTLPGIYTSMGNGPPSSTLPDQIGRLTHLPLAYGTSWVCKFYRRCRKCRHL